VGEVKALRWREDVDMVAGTITVNQQMRQVWWARQGQDSEDCSDDRSALGCAQAVAGDEGRTGDSKPGWPGQE